MADKPSYEELEQMVKDLEEKLDEQGLIEERIKLLSLAIEQSSEGIAVVDLGGNLEYLNDACAKMHEYTSEELFGKHLSVFHTPQQMLSVEAANQQLEETGDFKGEIWHVTRNGTKFPTLMHNLLIRDATNKPIGMMRTVRDISGIKQAQEALRESEEKFRFIFEAVPTSIVLIDKDGQIVDINPFHLKQISKGKITKKSFIGKNLVTHPSIVNAGLSETHKNLLEGVPFNHKEVYFPLTTGGIDSYFNVKGAPILRDDEVIGAVTTYEDITERKQAESALRESEGKLNAMLESIGDHMSMMDKDLNIIWANKFMKELFGNDIIGKKCYEVYHQRKEPCEPYPCITLKAFRDGKIHEHNTQVIDRNGKTLSFHCTANVALRDNQGNSTTVLEISRNVTEQYQAELALVERGKELENKTQELEEINAALRVLLKHRSEDKKDLENKVVANVKELIFPYVEKLNHSRLNDRQTVYLNIIKSNLEDIITPFLHQLSSKYSDLTPNEIQVAGLVKEGRTTKEIAELLNSSTGAINFHRNNLRKKFGLVNTKTNLRSFLLSLA
ncbi:MAG: PAS domain S-box protein [Deltaproteobacteria bacterium]|nr:PAS domain S-box protein [Deltaproteobacteria bacterium]